MNVVGNCSQFSLVRDSTNDPSSDIYYLVGNPAKVVSYAKWTVAGNYQNICGSITYTGTMSYEDIIPDWLSFTELNFTIQSSNQNDVGDY